VLEIKPKNILVIGDSILDAYVDGEVSRVSQEAPVPIVLVNNPETYSLGGAANTASNIVALGGYCSLVTLIGDDEAGKIFEEKIKEAGVLLFPFSDLRKTSKKLRVRARGQQMLRLDYEDTHEMLLSDLTDVLESTITSLIPNYDAVIVSDYNKGFLSKYLLQLISKSCLAAGKPLVIDPKHKDIRCYHNASYVTPNEKEIMDLCPGWDTPEEASCYFSKVNQCGVLLTKGAKGITLIGGGEVIKNWPTQAKEVFDVSGAGDTVVAAFTLALSSGSTEEEAIIFANKAAGVVVGKHGTATVTLKEIG
jgi:D-beta-D-heptose 7-phosphate kinase/D-beta-D-heptose 1-phosphate adenosyltransferase